MQSGESAVEFARRFCTDPAMIPRGLQQSLHRALPACCSAPARWPLSELAIESAEPPGILRRLDHPGPGRGHRHRGRRRGTCSRSGAGSPPTRSAPTWSSSRSFPQAGYIVGRCGGLHHFTLRYELLSVLGLTGLGAWFLAVTPPRAPPHHLDGARGRRRARHGDPDRPAAGRIRAPRAGEPEAHDRRSTWMRAASSTPSATTGGPT